MKAYTFLAQVQNRPGVLNKVAMIVRRKLFNIDTLTVSPTRNAGISSMTMVFKADSDAHADQVLKQLSKIVEMISIEQITADNSIREELLLIKMLPRSKVRLTELFDGLFYRVCFKTNAFMVVEACGSRTDLNRLLKLVPQADIIEIARTGVTSLKF